MCLTCVCLLNDHIGISSDSQHHLVDSIYDLDECCSLNLTSTLNFAAYAEKQLTEISSLNDRSNGYNVKSSQAQWTMFSTRTELTNNCSRSTAPFCTDPD